MGFLSEIPTCLISVLACCGYLALRPDSMASVRKAVLAFGFRSLQHPTSDDDAIRGAEVLVQCLPYVALLCLGAFVAAFAALNVVDKCWHPLIQLDFLAVACNLAVAIHSYEELSRERQLGRTARCRLVLAFHLPWTVTALLHPWGVGSWALGAYLGTRVACFCYRTLLSIPLLSPHHCLLAEALTAAVVAFQNADGFSTPMALAMVVVQLLLLLGAGFGVLISAREVVRWGYENAQRADEAADNLREMRLSFILKLCDAEVELCADFRILCASPSFGTLLGYPAEVLEQRDFLDLVAIPDQERVSNFLRDATSHDAQASIHILLVGPKRAEVQVYYASQNGRCSQCRYHLAVSQRSSMKEADTEQRMTSASIRTMKNTIQDDIDENASAYSESAVTRTPGTGGDCQASQQASDTLVYSESAAPGHKGSIFRQDLDGASWQGSETLACSDCATTRLRNFLDPKVIRDARAAMDRKETREVGVQTSGIQRPPPMPSPPPTPHPPHPPQPKRKSRAKKFNGRVSPSRQLVRGDAARMLLIEAAKQLNVKGTSCCSFHMVTTYMKSHVRSMLTDMSCRDMELYDDWQCSFCGILHSEDNGSVDEEGNHWCNICCSTEAPAESVDAETGRTETGDTGSTEVCDNSDDSSRSELAQNSDDSP